MQPLVVAEPVKGALRLAALNDAAARLGLKPGMALADARAMYPRIAVADADPDADRRMLERDRRLVRPLYAAGRPRSAGRLAARHHRLRASVRRRGSAAPRHRGAARAQGFQARAAVADTVGCAWAVARYGTDAARALRSDPRRLAPAAARRAADRAGDRRRARAGRPQAHRRRDRPPARAARRALRRELSCAASTRRSGREDEPITPRLPVPSFVTERRFAEPIAREDDVLGTIEHLAHELARLLERRGEGARHHRGRAVPHRRQGASHRRRHRRAAARRRAHPRAVRRAARGDRRRMRSRLRLRRGAARRARDRPLRSGADRPCRARPCGRACASRRPARRALRAAPRDAARAAGHAYSGICGGGGGGGGNLLLLTLPLVGRVASGASGWGSSEMHQQFRTRHPPPHLHKGEEGQVVLPSHRYHRSNKTPSPPPAPSACSSGRSRSKRSQRCRTARRCSSPGGACATRSRMPKAPSASPWNGGATSTAMR